MPRSSVPRRALVALTLAAASWGAATAISKRAVAEIPPLTLLAIQLAASLVLLAVLSGRRRDPAEAGDGGGSRILGRLGILNPGLAYALSLLGLVHISASLSVMLWALEPLLILLLAGLALGEQIGARLVALSVVAVAGMVLVIQEPGADGRWLGVALTVAGVACCAVYTVVARRWIATTDPTAGSTAGVVAAQQAWALGAALVAVVGVGLLGGTVRPDQVTPEGWLSAVASGCLYYGIAYWLYLSGLREVPASVAAVSFYLIPVFGVAASFVLLGERLDGRQWLGVAIVLVAVAAIMLGTAGRDGRAPRPAGPA